MGAQRFEELVVWKKAHQLVLHTYTLTRSFPSEERFGLSSQLRRSAVSVPANIAEGFRRRTPADKVRFYNIAQGSLEETRYYLILVQDLQYGDTSIIQVMLDEVARMLDEYVRKVRAT